MSINIERLTALDLRGSEPEDVRTIIYPEKIPAIKSVVNPETCVIRARKGHGFKKRSEMTYCPIEYCTSLQRATLPGQTMFYGVISDDQNHLENARAISCSECSQLAREGIQSVGREYFTVSQWRVTKPLNVVSFVADTTFPEAKNNQLLNSLRETFNESKFNESDKKFIRMISNEFSKIVTDNRDYLISATIATDLLTNTDIDGVVYPSAQLGGQAGLNIALSAKSVNKKLYFIRTIEETFYKNKEKSFLRIDKATDRGKNSISIQQVPNNYIEQDLNIMNLKDLPLIM